MSTIKVDAITDELGTGSPDFPNGITVNGSALTGLATAAQGALADSAVQPTDSLAAANLTGDLPAANLTGALPAIDGSALTGINSGSATVVRSTAFSGGTSYRYSYAHGQGSVPDLVWLELKILVAEHGYAVGASIKINNMLELDETDYVMSLSGTSTTLNYAGNQSSLYRYVARNDINSTADVVFATTSFETYLVGVWF